ncbi:MAG: S8 family serine peptidase [Bacteroidales bacterium]|nr:S8 family serine peptidase [Bacteroidales bacterium]
MRRISASFVFFLLLVVSTAQIAPDKYFVEFTDKNNSPYSFDKPLEFLSQRALNRRAVAGIPIVMNDIPVNPDYVEAVSLIGVDVITRSKWFNGVTIHTNDPARIAEIELLPFVSKVLKSGIKPVQPDPVADKFAIESLPVSPLNPSPGIPLNIADSADYGLSFTQVHMIRTDMLHNLGYRGKGMIIAILDAGFNLVDQLAPFDSLWANNQILGTRDFVNPGGNVFIGHTHGMSVLSIMGGYVPGQLIGSAPKADYWLLRSEDTGSEYLIEEYNWVSAAEFADSVGADVINSSLGYTVFDDTTQNHTCADMTGNTTPVTRGANIAFSKGILVVNSAGNEGGNPNWHCVSAPSDGFDVLGVAAVDSNGQYASFSSTGVVDGLYVKPNIAAMGRQTVISGSDGTITRGNGTSFSSPVMAGSAACLWQAFPEFSNATLKSAIEESASLFMTPNIYLGYGIPNLYEAYERLTGVDPVFNEESVVVYPNPSNTTGLIHVKITTTAAQILQVQVVDITGKQIYTRNDIRCIAGDNVISFSDLSFLKQGIYILKLCNLDGPALFETKIIQRIDW